MNRRRASRKRILQVREMQMQLAIGNAAEAQHHENELKANRDRLRQLCAQTYETQQCDMGRNLHAQMELGQRLLRAEEALEKALSDARQKLAEAERQRTAARIDREAAQKLMAQAERESEDEETRKQAMMPRAKATKNRRP
ncbi:MAG: hypothetical protein AAGH53_06515 [Pseudomonadota bacterium]